MSRDFWTKERVAVLRRMWRRGDFVRDIAKALGVTRNAIIGKADRLGLPRRNPVKFGDPAKRSRLISEGRRNMAPEAKEAWRRQKSAHHRALWANPEWRAAAIAARWGGR